MLYNFEKKRVKKDSDCNWCEHFEKSTKKCKGFGACCFEYDQLTGSCIDPITKLPFNPTERENAN